MINEANGYRAKPLNENDHTASIISNCPLLDQRRCIVILRILCKQINEVSGDSCYDGMLFTLRLTNVGFRDEYFDIASSSRYSDVVVELCN